MLYPAQKKENSMKYQKLCDEIITKVGGRDNVLDVSHCITRLRFHLKDESLAQTNELKATKASLTSSRPADSTRS